MEEEKRNIKLEDKKIKENFLNYKIFIWTVFGFLILSISIFLILFINYKNKQNDLIIDEFSDINLNQNK